MTATSNADLMTAAFAADARAQQARHETQTLTVGKVTNQNVNDETVFLNLSMNRSGRWTAYLADEGNGTTYLTNFHTGSTAQEALDRLEAELTTERERSRSRNY